MKRTAGAVVAIIGTGIVAGCLVISGCEGEADEPVVTHDRDLALGARGADVRAVNTYLKTFGYFPNAELATQFPAWRPIVATSPADASEFGQPTQDAVRRLQAARGLAVTGVVDRATRALMAKPRCGVPDGIEHPTGDDKWAIVGIGASGSAANGIPYEVSVTNGDDGITASTIGGEAFLALGLWSNETRINVLPNQNHAGTNAAPHVTVKFAQLANGVAGTTTGWGGCCPVITLNTLMQWSTAASTPAGSMDVRTALLHNLGHALGLDHSSTATALMEPSLPPNDRTLKADDAMAVSAADDQYQSVIGSAFDIAAGEDGSVWVIGDDVTPGGFGVWKWNGFSGWNRVPGNLGGVRIAVRPNGFPVIVTGENQIFAFSSSDPNTGSWSQLGGPSMFATDIAASGGLLTHHVWVIGTVNANNGFRIYKWDGVNNFIVDQTNQGGKRISVDRSGVPWIITNSGGVMRRTSNNPSNGAWQALPGSSLVDVGVGNFLDTDGSTPTAAFVTNTSGQLWTFSEQTGGGSGEFFIPTKFEWRIAGNDRVGGAQSPRGFGASEVAVSLRGRVWALGSILGANIGRSINRSIK